MRRRADDAFLASNSCSLSNMVFCLSRDTRRAAFVGCYWVGRFQTGTPRQACGWVAPFQSRRPSSPGAASRLPSTLPVRPAGGAPGGVVRAQARQACRATSMTHTAHASKRHSAARCRLTPRRRRRRCRRTAAGTAARRARRARRAAHLCSVSCLHHRRRARSRCPHAAAPRRATSAPRAG